MASQNELKKTARQYQIEERRIQVSIMLAQGMTEIAIGEKLGVDNSTISKDVKALKLISQQFIYDITKSDFTYYYKQCLDLVKHVLQNQLEIIGKEHITKQDVIRSRILSDILGTVSTLNDYYKAAPDLHRSPIQQVYDDERFGTRPGTKTHVPQLTEEEERESLLEMAEEDAAEEAKMKILEKEIEEREKAATEAVLKRYKERQEQSTF